MTHEKDITKATYTLEELKEVYDNPTPMTQDEIDTTFITDEQTKNLDVSNLKIKGRNNDKT